MPFSFFCFLGMIALCWIAFRAHARIDLLSEELLLLRGRLNLLERKPAEQSRETPAGESLQTGLARSVEPPPAATFSAPPPLPLPKPSEIAVAPPSFAQEVPPLISRAPDWTNPISEEPPRIPVAAPRAAAAPVAPWNWEQFFGARLFAWIGGLVLFLGVAFFLKYSFERNLIPPWMRVAAGYCVGLGLLTGGVLLKRKELQVTAHTLCASGIVILYAATFAAQSFYHLIGRPIAFTAMTLTTAGAFVLALFMEAQVIALLGMLAGFLTPILFSSGVDAPGALFTYIGLLDLGLIAVALRRHWKYLVVLGAFSTICMQLGWLSRFYSPPKFHTAVVIFSAFNLLFLLPLALNRRRGSDSWWETAGALLNPAFTAVVLLGFAASTAARDIPLAFFVLMFVMDLAFILTGVLRPRSAAVSNSASGIVFLILGIWIARWSSPALLKWMLCIPLLFGLLHTFLPVLLRRWGSPDTPASAWTQFAPVLTIILFLTATLTGSHPSLMLWPFVLLMNLAALAMAACFGSIAAFIAAMIGTFVGTGLWVEKIAGLPLAGSAQNLQVLLLLTFFGAGFFASACWIRARNKSDDQFEILPGLTALLPFALLFQICIRLPFPNPTPIFATAAIFSTLALGFSLWKNVPGLALATLAGSAMLQYGWHFAQFKLGAAGISFAWHAAFYIAFSLFPLIGKRSTDGRFQSWIASALSGPVHFPVIYLVINQTWPNSVMGIVPAAFAILPYILLQWIRQSFAKESPRRLSLLAWFGGVTLLFITLIMPIQFEREWLTISWALEGMALFWLFNMVPHPGLKATGLVLLAISTIRLAAIPLIVTYHTRSSNSIWNWYLYTYGIVIFSLLAAVRLHKGDQPRVFGIDPRSILCASAGLLAFLFLNIEIANHFATGPYLTFEFSGNFARDMSYSISWAMFALLLLVIGIKVRSTRTRLSSVVLLAITLAKLFLHDLSRLDELYRIGAFIGVALVLMFSAFLYQKFLGKSQATEPSQPTP